jgi:hypothetical protein
MIDWDSHGLAFRRLSRQRKISTAKLIHQLINTNRQNNLYYGDSPTCPCCKHIEESFLHVLSCSDVSAIAHRSSALSHLLSSLKQIGTPPKIITAFEHGFQHWMASSTRIHAPHSRSTRLDCGPPDYSLSRAVSRYWLAPPPAWAPQQILEDNLHLSHPRIHSHVLTNLGKLGHLLIMAIYTLSVALPQYHCT